MQPRNLVIGALGLVCVLGMFKLMVDAKSSDEVDVDEVAMNKALQEHKRNQGRSATPSSVAKAPKVERSKVRSVLPDKEEKVETPRDRVKSLPAASLRPPVQSMSDKAQKGTETKAAMADANKMYDRADYEGAREAAKAILEDEPENVRMLRIVVSTSCIMGEEKSAKESYSSLPKRDQMQMSRRCKRYGIEFDE